VEQTSGRSAVVSTLASLASVVVALSCCLPLGTMLMAAGSAGASLFSEKLRPWLLALSIASLLFAFVQTYYRKRCEFRHRRLRTCLLWFSATIVTGMLAAPASFSSILAGHLPFTKAAGTLDAFQQADFVREFDAASDRTRIVALFSPT
jgi:hypothetical protein